MDYSIEYTVWHSTEARVGSVEDKGTMLGGTMKGKVSCIV